MKELHLQGSRVYLQPHSRKFVHIIGGFGFGSCPAVFYRSLALRLSERKYSVILHPFPFNPLRADHWSLAIALYRRLKILQLQELPALAGAEGALERSNHAWIGHSLGCKLIELLELLSLEEPARRQALRSILSEAETEALYRQIDGLSSELGEIARPLLARLEQAPAGSGDGAAPDAQAAGPSGEAREQLQHLLERRASQAAPGFIRNQTSLLLAPQISGAVRIPPTGITIYNADVQPSWEQSCFLVRSQTSIFQLTGLVGFSEDAIARDDILFLRNVLGERPINHGRPDSYYRELAGSHLAPLRPTDELIDTIDSLLTSLAARGPEPTPAA